MIKGKILLSERGGKSVDGAAVGAFGFVYDELSGERAHKGWSLIP